MRQLDVRQMARLVRSPPKDRVILTPVELERHERAKGQGHESSTPCLLILLLPIRPPIPGKCRNTATRTCEAGRHQISMLLLRRPPLLTRPARRGLQPAGKLPANGSSLRTRSGVVNIGSTVPAFGCFAVVVRDSPVRRLISRIDSFSGKDIRLMIFKNPEWITPSPPTLRTDLREGSLGLILNGNHPLTRLTSEGKSMRIRHPAAISGPSRSRPRNKDLADAE